MGVRSCTRRELLGRIGVGTASAMAAACLSSCRLSSEEKRRRLDIRKEKPAHIVTLSFDDGFRKSSIRTAEIYEKYKLSACINVIATGQAHVRQLRARQLRAGHRRENRPVACEGVRLAHLQYARPRRRRLGAYKVELP